MKKFKVVIEGTLDESKMMTDNYELVIAEELNLPALNNRVRKSGRITLKTATLEWVND